MLAELPLPFPSASSQATCRVPLELRQTIDFHRVVDDEISLGFGGRGVIRMGHPHEVQVLNFTLDLTRRTNI